VVTLVHRNLQLGASKLAARLIIPRTPSLLINRFSDDWRG
jgi:hypothetical protein